MNPRKRHAAEPLLPLHAPKQPRTTMVAHDGGNPSPSEKAGLASRWSSLWKDMTNLAFDSVRAFASLSMGNNISESHFQPLENHQIDRAHSDDSVRDNPGDYISSGSSGPQQRAASPHYSQGFPLSSKSTVADLEQKASSDFFLPTPDSSSYPPKHERRRAVSSSSQNISLFSPKQAQPSPPQQVQSSSPRKTKSSSPQKVQNGVIIRKYANRKHIFADKHKANVLAENLKRREEMQRQIYVLERKRGYASTFTDFQGLLAFKAKLESIDQRSAFSPSSSMTNLSAREVSPVENRRHSYSDNNDMEFLKRVLDMARATLNEPKPPQPFQPSLEQLRKSQRAKDDRIEQRLRPKRVPPSPLPPEADVQINALLSKRGIVSKYAKEQVNDQDLSRLRPSQWLNDEIINFYGALILGRSEDCKENPITKGRKLLNVHYFSTFFWTKLKEGYVKSRLAKWTKKIDIFSKDIILIPVNHSNAHWTGAAINFRQRRIESYDSMGTRRDIVFKLLRSYLESEHQDKKKKPFDFTGWQDYSIEEPLQENGHDCGVFTCQFLQGLSKGDEIVSFTQKDMPHLRRRMIWEICHATLRDDP